VLELKGAKRQVFTEKVNIKHNPFEKYIISRQPEVKRATKTDHRDESHSPADWCHPTDLNRRVERKILRTTVNLTSFEGTSRYQCQDH
jgi:hypothetical protein